MNSINELAAIVESAHDAIFSKTLDGTVTSWNFGAERMYGYGEKEMIGSSVLKLFPAGYEAEFDYIMSRIRKGMIIDHFLTKRKRKDGTVIDVSLMISPIRDKSGDVIAASVIGREVTAQIADRRQRDRKQLLAYILIIVIGFVGFLSLEHLGHKINTESKQRSITNCETVVREDAVLRALVERTSAPIAAPANADPALKQVFADANDRTAAFKAYAQGLLRDPDCSKLATGTP